MMKKSRASLEFSSTVQSFEFSKRLRNWLTRTFDITQSREILTAFNAPKDFHLEAGSIRDPSKTVFIEVDPREAFTPPSSVPRRQNDLSSRR